MSEGFPDWRYLEYKSFLRGCEKFGRQDYESICRLVNA
jgi:hypothetical protein